jgi:hypothetical protein
MWQFPKRKGKIPNWMLGHCLLTFAIFTLIYWFTYNQFIAGGVAMLFYPLRAVLWKAPGRPGHDVKDPVEDYGWGAIVPVIMVFILMVVITIV